MENYTAKIAELLGCTEDVVRWTLDALHSSITMLEHVNTDSGLFKGMPLQQRIDSYFSAVFAPREFSWGGEYYPMNGEAGCKLMLAFRNAIWDEEGNLTHPNKKEIYEQLVELLG